MAANILIIEDESNIAQLIRLFQVKAGYNVLTAADGLVGGAGDYTARSLRRDTRAARHAAGQRIRSASDVGLGSKPCLQPQIATEPGVELYVSLRWAHVDMHIGTLRKKLEAQPDAPHYIKTVWGVGDKFIFEDQ
jgi:DNA-binding response OmpR family regulator